MIDKAIDYILREVRQSLSLGSSNVFSGNVHELKESSSQRGLYVSLVNLEEEATLKNGSHFFRQNNSTKYKQPPVFLNLATWN